MKEITINGEVFQYEVDSETDPYEFGHYYWTDFYQGTEKKLRPQWKFWKGLKTVEVPKYVFTVHDNIESEHLSKEEVRELVERPIKLLRRKGEIQRGEIV